MKFYCVEKYFFPSGQVLSEVTPVTSSRWTVLFYWIIRLTQSLTFWMLLLKLWSILSRYSMCIYKICSKYFNKQHSWQVYTITNDWSLLWFLQLVFWVFTVSNLVFWIYRFCLPFRIWCSGIPYSAVPGFTKCWFPWVFRNRSITLYVMIQFIRRLVSWFAMRICMVWVSTQMFLYTSCSYHHFYSQILICQEIELSCGLFRDSSW